jgi:hypothetical protein
MIVSFNRGQMLDALQASATFWFVIVRNGFGDSAVFQSSTTRLVARLETSIRPDMLWRRWGRFMKLE